ncbi:hypothetical protein RMR21_009235 [Agrobacterium sp. rho-8.1]|nr:hypothetical protein [Agrobacterium sp. rho-8.1]
MSTLLTINVKNYEPQTQNFYFFQQPAIYTGGGAVYSNSLFSQSLGNYDQTGAILTFEVNMQFYAGIQQANTPPQVGASSGFASASRPIDLAPAAGASGSPNDLTTATVAPVGLSLPTNGPGIQPGAFRVATPSFTSPPYFNVGSAVAVNGGIILSNFVQADPMGYADCQPILKYYVQTGSYTPGSVMNFTQSSINAAIADFTGGYTTCNVSLLANGNWSAQLQ